MRNELAGLLPQTPGRPTIGVFLNDGTGGKIGYYLSNEIAVTAGDCRTDGRRLLTVKVTLHYTARSSGLPAYVRGPAQLVDPYSLQTNLPVSRRSVVVWSMRWSTVHPMASSWEGRAQSKSER